MDEYRVNGVGVGRSPDSFSRSIEYLEAFDKIGNSQDNIQVVKGFLSEQECQSTILQALTSAPAGDGQWLEMIYQLGGIEGSVLDKILTVKQMWEKHFGLKVDIRNKPYMVGWGPGKGMGLHVDDLGGGEEHMSAVIYLNNEYTGGQISFPTHNIEISPGVGDLIIFPGNLNYPHEVKPVISGKRYTIPIWSKILEASQ
jgi:hypothetical protein